MKRALVAFAITVFVLSVSAAAENNKGVEHLLETLAGEQIRVLGEAQKPQVLPYKQKMTVLDVMIAVGGLTDFADGNHATISIAAKWLDDMNNRAELAQIGQDQASKVAAEAAARAEEVGVEARTVVLRGFPVEEICLAAEKYEPRFLVIGSHGWRTVKRVLFGSVSTGVLHHAACPVLVVRGEETPQNGAKADGAREHIHAVS